MPYRTCDVRGCSDKSSPRHRFPNPHKNPERYQKWLDLVDNPVLKSKDPDLVFRSHRICHIHFKLEDRSTNWFLQKTAVPSLYLPQPKYLSK